MSARGWRGGGGRRGGRRGGSASGFREQREDFIKHFEDSMAYQVLGTSDMDDPNLTSDFIQSMRVVGCYSEDKEKQLINNKSHLSFLQPQYLPPLGEKTRSVCLDLTQGYAGSTYSGSRSKGIENFFLWIKNNKDIFFNETKSNKAGPGGQFITMKTTLASVIDIPYKTTYNDILFKIKAVCIQGKIFLMLGEKQNHTDTNVSSWNHKFHQYMTKDMEDLDETVMENELFRVVLKANLGPHKLFYSASTDCADPNLFKDDFTDMSSFYTIKSTFEPKSEYNEIKFKMIYWLLQMLLTGAPKLLVGYKSREGIVSMLKYFERDELIEHGKEFWNAGNCLNFLSEFLTLVKRKVEAKPGVVFCFEHSSQDRKIICTGEDRAENCLPEWFFQDILESWE